MVVLSKPAIEQFGVVKSCKPPTLLPGIPLIDLSKPDSKSCLVKACEEFGFFKVINHGVPTEFFSKLESEAIKFFSSPMSEKEKAGPADPFGYGNKSIGSNGDIGWVEYLLLTTSQEFNYQRIASVFGENPKNFSGAVNDYVSAVKKMACEILELLADGLRIQQRNVFSRLLMDEQSDSVFRLNHYPPCPELHGRNLIGFGEHTDPQIISVLRSNNTSGLQISLRDDGSWISVPPDQDSFFINVGDSLQTYLGIQIFRFYFKCTKCSAEITMKTDPQNSDYVAESGASRNFEPWRAEDEVADEEKRKRDTEEMGDAMKSLENRTLDSKREMDILAALDEMKSMKSRHATVSVDAMLDALQRSAPKEEDRLVEEEEALIKSIFQGPQGSREFVKRIHDEDFDDDEDLIEDNGKSSNNSSKRKKVSEEFSVNPTDHLTKLGILDVFKTKGSVGDSKAPGGGKFIFKSSAVRVSAIKKIAVASNGCRREKEDKQEGEQKTNIEHRKQEDKTNITTNGLQSLCQHYESDEDD